MPYRIENEDGNSKEVPVESARSDDYKTYYAHGAQGGILGGYHYRIDFYRDDVPPTTGVREFGGTLTHDDKVIKREIDCSVYIPLPFAKQLRDWLDRNIKQHEEDHGVIPMPVPEDREELE